MRYLLDTPVLIDFSKRREPAVSRLRTLNASGDELGVCAINVAEFFAGVPAHQRERWSLFFDALSYWEVDQPIARMGGAWRYDYARMGYRLSTADVLIAAVAASRRAVLLTSNAKDFPMPGLQVEKLR